MPMTEEHKVALAEGRKRAAEARKSAADTAAPETPSNCVSVTYAPFDGDPHTIKWNNIEFKANVAVALDPANPKHRYEVLEPTFVVNPSTGRQQSSHIEVSKFMGDLARGNPSFIVDGVRAPKLVSTEKLPPAGAEWLGHNAELISQAPWPDSA